MLFLKNFNCNLIGNPSFLHQKVYCSRILYQEKEEGKCFASHPGKKIHLLSRKVNNGDMMMKSILL